MQTDGQVYIATEDTPQEDLDRFAEAVAHEKARSRELLAIEMERGGLVAGVELRGRCPFCGAELEDES